MVPLLTQIALDIFIWLIVFRFGSFRFSYRRSRIFRQTQRLASGAFPIGICSRKSSAGLWRHSVSLRWSCSCLACRSKCRGSSRHCLPLSFARFFAFRSLSRPGIRPRDRPPPSNAGATEVFVWRISAGAGASSFSRMRPLISSREGGEDPQRNASNMPGSPSGGSFVQSPFLSIRLL